MEALGVYQEIYDLQLPEIKAEKLKEESEFLINSARKIKKEAEDLFCGTLVAPYQSIRPFS